MSRLTYGSYSIPKVNETRRDRGVSVMSALKTKSDYLIDRFKSWRKDRRGYSANQIDRTWRKYLGKP